MDEDSVNLIEEMNRFEAEIASGQVLVRDLTRPIIGANTFNRVQQQLDGFPPPRVRLPGAPSGPAPPLIPMQLLPAPPPSGPGFPLSGPPASSVFAGIPPPPPPPAFLVPHQVRGNRPMAAARLPPPPPSMGLRPRPGPVVLSAAPTKYRPPKKTKFDDELNEFMNEIKQEEQKLISNSKKQEKSSAKLMAEQVRANTVVSVHHVSSAGDDTEYNPQQGHAGKSKKEKKTKKTVRCAGGQVWEDNTLVDWEDDDFRIFCGDLGNDVTDEVLIRAFNKYPSFLKAKVVRDKRTNKTKGFGFVSFKDPQDFIKAMKEMNGRYVGSRPIKLRKSCWRQRSLDAVKKKEKEKAALINLLTGRST